MLDGFTLDLKHLSKEINKNKADFSPIIPSSGTPTNQLNSYYEKVNDMTIKFNQKKPTDYDMYLISDVLGIPYSRQECLKNFYEG